MIDAEKTIQRAAAEITRLQDFDVGIRLRIDDACNLVGSLQLALRHPELPAGAKATSRILVDTIVEAVRHQSSELADFLELGNGRNGLELLGRRYWKNQQ
jgi:hypothetical protein